MKKIFLLLIFCFFIISCNNTQIEKENKKINGIQFFNIDKSFNFEIKEKEIDYSSFWVSDNDTLRLSLIDYYSSNNSKTNFTIAEHIYILGILTNNVSKICESIPYYNNSISENKNNLLIYENLFFLSDKCDLDSNYYLNILINNSIGWKKEFYNNLLNNNLTFHLEPVNINKKNDIPKNITKIILGKSFIKIENSTRLGIQIDRYSMDWLSNKIYNYPPNPVNYNNIIPYHEGSRIKEIMDMNVNPKIIPLTPIIALYKEGGWYTPDENGIFRFEILKGHIISHTTKCYKNICLISSTHGISMLVPQAINNQIEVVVGCMDAISKMEAAYYLSKKNISIYSPADRFIGDLIGHDGEGTIIGTAPINEGIIGNQSITIYLNETILVQDTKETYPIQYYDTPARYFKELNKIIKLNIKFIEVNNLGETKKVIDYAKNNNINLVAIRVFEKEDYIAVKKWLNEDPNNRAILFHSALYPEGYSLFKEFPKQTSFGDTKPIFI
jgi:hypothetical protein